MNDTWLLHISDEQQQKRVRLELVVSRVGMFPTEMQFWRAQSPLPFQQPENLVDK